MHPQILRRKEPSLLTTKESALNPGIVNRQKTRYQNNSSVPDRHCLLQAAATKQSGGASMIIVWLKGGCVPVGQAVGHENLRWDGLERWPKERQKNRISS